MPNQEFIDLIYKFNLSLRDVREIYSSEYQFDITDKMLHHITSEMTPLEIKPFVFKTEPTQKHFTKVNLLNNLKKKTKVSYKDLENIIESQR